MIGDAMAWFDSFGFDSFGAALRAARAARCPPTLVVDAGGLGVNE